MPQEVISGYRSSADGLNYEAVMKAVRRSDASPTPYRSIDSVRREQTVPSERSEKVRVRRRRSSVRRQSRSFYVTKKGVFYVLATVGLLVFVKFTIRSAQDGGLFETRNRQETQAILAR